MSHASLAAVPAHNPRRFRRHRWHAALGSGVLLVAGAMACSGEPSTSAGSGPETTGDDNPAGALTGEVTAVSILDAQGVPSMSYFLTPPGAASPMRLLFATDPNLTSSTRLRVWGQPEGGAFRVERQVVLSDETIDDTGIVRRALIGQPSTNVTVAWVQMNVNGGGVNQTAAAAQSLIFGQNAGPLFGTKATDKSVAQYYDENSYGMVKLVGQVEGPIPFTGTACNNFDPLATNVVSQVTALGRTYQHYYLYWGSEQDCGPGWGAQGTSTKPGKYVWLNNDGTFCTATGQELGHNFGLMHASTMKCTGATIANDTSTCTSNEYGNPMTVMGGGCRHLMSVEKWYSGFFKSCNAVKLKASGTFTLLPIEIPCGGIQALQIPMPPGAPVRTTTTSQSNGNVTVGFYYLELRGGQGMDTGMKTGVYVHAAADIPSPTQNGVRTFLLDMNPATTAWDPMTVGQTFTDPAGGVSFTLNSADTNSASVTVTITEAAPAAATPASTARRWLGLRPRDLRQRARRRHRHGKRRWHQRRRRRDRQRHRRQRHRRARHGRRDRQRRRDGSRRRDRFGGRHRSRWQHQRRGRHCVRGGRQHAGRWRLDGRRPRQLGQRWLRVRPRRACGRSGVDVAPRAVAGWRAADDPSPPATLVSLLVG